mgnify:CR=1 FL=1
MVGARDSVGARVGGQASEPGLFVNMLTVLTLSERSQHRYWLKAEASRNMKLTSVTESMFQMPMGWLNAEAW